MFVFVVELPASYRDRYLIIILVSECNVCNVELPQNTK